jgi:hypothetical protein
MTPAFSSLDSLQLSLAAKEIRALDRHFDTLAALVWPRVATIFAMHAERFVIDHFSHL